MTKPGLKPKLDIESGPFILPPLPYDEGALAPIISARTVGLHYGKHHKGYVDKLNDLVKDTPFATMSLEEVVENTAGQAKHSKIFNNAAQAWNHAFYWNSLSPDASMPGAALGKAIDRDFGGMDTLKKHLVALATDHFASGWAWLIVQDKKLALIDTPDAHTPMTEGATCLLTIDVWEHAYYLDRQNVRKDYVAGVVDRLLNWTAASANFDKTL